MKTSILLSDRTYLEYIYDLLTEQTLSLEKFIHHKHTTRLRHSLYVSYLNYRICRILKLDSRSAARAGLLHDYFFYERKEYNKKRTGPGHMRAHPSTALENASSEFEISDREADIILNHMWPCTFKRPRYPESVIIILVDKFCAVSEVLRIKNKTTRL